MFQNQPLICFKRSNQIKIFSFSFSFKYFKFYCTFNIAYQTFQNRRVGVRTPFHVMKNFGNGGCSYPVFFSRILSLAYQLSLTIHYQKSMKTYSVLEEETVHSKLLIRKVQKRSFIRRNSTQYTFFESYSSYIFFSSQYQMFLNCSLIRKRNAIKQSQ